MGFEIDSRTLLLLKSKRSMSIKELDLSYTQFVQKESLGKWLMRERYIGTNGHA